MSVVGVDWKLRTVAPELLSGGGWWMENKDDDEGDRQLATRNTFVEEWVGPEGCM